MLTKSKSLFPYIAIATLLCIFFSPILFLDRVYVPGDFLRSDTLQQNLPFQYLLYQKLRSGQLPLWTNLVGNGFPIFAEGQIAALHPFKLLYLFMPFFSAYSLILFLNYLVAAYGAYTVCRYLKYGIFPSIFASLAFSLSGFFVFHLTHINIVAAASIFPWLFWSYFRLFEYSNNRNRLITVIFTALSFLSGSLQISFYSLVALLIYFITSQKVRSPKTYLYITSQFFLIVFAAACLTAIQLLPALELLANSTRQTGIGSLALDSLPFHPRNLLTFFTPYVFGDPGKGTYPHFGESWGMFWENNLYFGLTAFLLTILSLAKILMDKKIFSLWITAGILLLLVLGKYSPLFPVYYLPVFNFFRVTGRFSFALLFFLCLLAAYSFEAFLRLVPPKFRFIAGIALTAVLVTELFVNGFGYNPTASAKNIAIKPQVLGYIEKSNRIISLADFIIYDKINAKGWRYNIDSNIGHLNNLGADANILWNIQNSDIYSGLFLENNRQWQSVLFQNIFLDKNNIKISSPSMKLLSLANVCSLTSGYPLSNTALSLRGKITKDKQVYFAYHNINCLPKGLLYDNAIAADRTVQQRILLSEDFDPKKHLLIDSVPFSSTSDENGSNENRLNLIEQANGYYKFRVISGKNRWLLLQETYFPGWNVYVNGINRPLAKADLTFMAANIPAGDSEIIFTYQPFSFYLGAIISVFSLILLLYFVLFSKRIYTVA